MRKKEKPKQWEVIRLKSLPAAFLGVVDAPDQQTARKLAIEQFKVRPADQRRPPVGCEDAHPRRSRRIAANIAKLPELIQKPSSS